MTQRKDGRWQKSITINGKRVFFYSSEPTERKALKDIEQQLLAYTEKEEKGATFEEVATSWLASCEGKIGDGTLYHYHSYVEKLKNAFGNEYIKDIKAKDINDFYRRLALQDFKLKSIINIHSAMRLVFKHAVVEYGLDADPTSYVTLPKAKASTPRQALTEDEQKRVVECVDLEGGLFAYFLLYTGMRRGEALALKWENIDFENKTITVTDNVVFVNNRAVIKPPKTEAGIRNIVLLDCLAEKLINHIPKDKSEYVFSDNGKKHLGGTYYQRSWKRYQKASGLNITPHQLRHTYATILFEAGIDTKDAQNLMGHSDITTTRNIYTHIRQTRLTDTANRLNSFISNAKDV